MLNISFNNSDARAAASLRAKGPRIVQALKLRMDALMIKLQGYIQSQKLEGQVLHHRTGHLTGSIRAMPAVQEANTLTAEVLGGGGPIFYARIHEYGGSFA